MIEESGQNICARLSSFSISDLIKYPPILNTNIPMKLEAPFIHQLLFQIFLYHFTYVFIIQEFIFEYLT